MPTIYTTIARRFRTYAIIAGGLAFVTVIVILDAPRERGITRRTLNALSALTGIELVSRQRTELEREGGQALLAREARAANAIVVFANPANCAVNRAWGKSDSRSAATAHLKGVFLVAGFSDTLAAIEAVRDLGLDFEVRILSSRHGAVLMQHIGVPSLALVRSSEVLFVANGNRFESAPSWLDVVLSTNDEKAITHTPGFELTAKLRSQENDEHLKLSHRYQSANPFVCFYSEHRNGAVSDD